LSNIILFREILVHSETDKEVSGPQIKKKNTENVGYTLSLNVIWCSKVHLFHKWRKKGKGKAHPLQAVQAQRGLGELRLLDFLTSALTHRPPLPPGTSLVLIFTRG
jgi:hypothetical protein